MEQMNKKGWTARSYLIGVILISTVVALGYLMIGSHAIDYGNPNIVDEKFSEHYDKLTENAGTASKMLSSASNSSGFNLISTADVLLSSTFTTVNLIFSSLGNFGSQILSIGGDFGIPSSISGVLVVAFLAILTISIVLIVINAVNKTNKL